MRRFRCCATKNPNSLKRLTAHSGVLTSVFTASISFLAPGTLLLSEIGNLTLRSSITSSGSVAGFTASATVAGEGRYPIKMCGSIDLASGTISGLRPTLVGQPTGGISLTTTLDRPFRGERVRTRCLLGTCS